MVFERMEDKGIAAMGQARGVVDGLALPDAIAAELKARGVSVQLEAALKAWAAGLVAAETERCATMCEDRAIHQNGTRIVTLEMNQMARALRGQHDFRG